MSEINLNGYYDRSDSEQAKNYERHLFRAGNVVQSAEVNEIQQTAAARHKRLGDSLYKDGDVVSNASASLDPQTGVMSIASGAVYLRGDVRGVPAGTLTIPTTGTVVVGVYLRENIITETTDATLLDPAKETRGYNEPGAARLQVIPTWGYLGDGKSGDFFAVYYADDGALRAKEPPPQFDAVTQAIARYDRDSTGSSYIVEGMTVSMLDDDSAKNQVYTVKEGRARVNGFGISLPTARRIIYVAQPDLKFIDSEPHISTTVDAQRITVDRPPIANITQVRINTDRTVSIVHGSVSGSADPLPDTSIIDILSVTQNGKTYIKGADYKLTQGKVDWSLPGDEIATGSTYSVTYRYIKTVVPTAVDDDGFTVIGAVVGTLIEANYNTKLPRIDRLCINQDGAFVWVKGVSTDYNPVRPQTSESLLPLCQVYQTWTSSRRIINDGLKLVSMAEIGSMSDRLDNLTDLVAQQKLISDINTRDASAKKGLFVDPFVSDEQRDQGIAQTAAVLGYALTLPISGSAVAVNDDVDATETCHFTLETALQQTARTGSMQINPYLAFSVPPVPLQLTPSVDRWTETQTSWTSGVTQKFIIDNSIRDQWHINTYGSELAGWPSYSTSTTSTVVAGSNTTSIEYIRQIEVTFHASGFGPNEVVNSVIFDGVAVPVAAI